MARRWPRSLVVLFGTLLVLQLLIMATGIGGIVVVDAAGGYVRGEATYTRAQQRATEALRRYVLSGAAAELETYRREVEIPHATALARMVLIS